MLSFVNFLFLSLGESASTENCEDYEDEESDWKKCDAELIWVGGIDGKLAEHERDSHQKFSWIESCWEISIDCGCIGFFLQLWQKCF